MIKPSLPITRIELSCKANQVFDTNKKVISGVHSYRFVRHDYSCEYYIIRGDGEEVGYLGDDGSLYLAPMDIPGLRLENLGAFLARLGIIF